MCADFEKTGRLGPKSCFGVQPKLYKKAKKLAKPDDLFIDNRFVLKSDILFFKYKGNLHKLVTP